MSWGTLRPQIKTLLDANTDIEEVSGTPKLNFSAYPAAVVVPSENSGDYSTTSENERVYAFKVQLFYSTKDVGIATAMDRLEEVVDDVLDAIDQEDQKGSTTRTIGINLPAGYDFLSILATPGRWGEIEGLELLMAEITVAIKVSRDVV